jgi:hypothetical protein
MATRCFAYNPTQAAISGATLYGTLAVENSPQDYSSRPGGIVWWMGPEEDTYVIAGVVPSSDFPTPVGSVGTVQFWKTSTLSDSEFLSLAQLLAGTIFVSASAAKTWLESNNYWTNWTTSIIPTTGLVLNLNTWDSGSWPGSGTTWYDLTGNNNNAQFQGTAGYDSEIEAMVFVNDIPGNDAHMSFPATSGIPIGNSQYTISIWYNSSEPVSNGGFIGWGNYGSSNQVNALRQLNSGGNSALVNYWWGNDLAVVTPITAGTWYNLVAIFDGTTRRICLNGTQIASDTPTGHDVNSSANMTIGVTNSTEYFWGFISQVLVYNQRLNSTEVLSIFNANKWRYGY